MEKYSISILDGEHPYWYTKNVYLVHSDAIHLNLIKIIQQYYGEWLSENQIDYQISFYYEPCPMEATMILLYPSMNFDSQADAIAFKLKYMGQL